MLDVKQELALTREDSGDDGGFLLGSSRREYEQLCLAQRMLVLQVDDALAGLAASLDDRTFRDSEVWERKEMVDWRDFSPEEVESERVGYFDQLAVAPRFQDRYFGAMLALATVERLFAEEHRYVFATTVVEPVTNSAALPLMEKVRGREVGRLEESYPQVGDVTSVIHLIERDRCRAGLAELEENGTELEQATIARVKAAFEHA
jgi:ribosomal protein S18 acetylase RimI-like enzyme